MYLFDNKPKKVARGEFKSVLGIDLDSNPYTIETMKSNYRAFPRHYFSGWQNTPDSTPLIEFEQGRSPLASTNFEAHLSARSYENARSASKRLQQNHGIPFRTWMASFVSKTGLNRPLHYDWYDGILFNFAGRKELTMYMPLNISTDGFFRYITDGDKMEPPTSSGEKFILDPGDALYIPAFAHHLVENTSGPETAAVSFAFDTSTLLIDIFRLTLEYCTKETRTAYQPRSMGGARAYGTVSNWQIWKESAKAEHVDHLIYKKICEELARDVPLAAKALTTDPNAQTLIREEWRKFVGQEQLEISTYFNP